ncbi:MAG: chalcone isomerase family protein [Congregibacter sp.]|nr:chalcone isomerase family protein [Congregibacter sp.]
MDRGEAYRLTYTGRAQRVFLFFKVYEIAHYIAYDSAHDAVAEGAPGASEAPALSPETVVNDERGKAIFIRFNRTLGRERIRNEFALSILKNAQADWLVEAQPSIDAFMAAIDRDARADDQLVFFWLPGGRLLVEFNEEQAFEATDAAFAKLIWSIWFGAEPVCDPKELLAQIAPKGAA